MPKALLPEGNGRDVYPRVHVNGGAVCLARAPYVSVWLLAERGVLGKPGCHAPGNCCHPRSFHCTPSLSACWCRRSSCNTHAIVLLGPRRAFTNVARALAWAYQTLMDSLMTLCMNSVHNVWGQSTPCGLAAWRGCARLPPTAPLQPAPTVGGAPTQPVSPPFDPTTPQAAGKLAPTHGFGPSRPIGGAPFQAALHRGGTWCLAPCSGGRTGAPRQSMWGCCPCGAP